MKNAWSLAVALGIGLWALEAQGQLFSWVQPAGRTMEHKLVLSTNQFMEVLSVSLDSSASIDVTVGEDTVTLGTGGNPNIPVPMIIAGPATVVLRKSSTAGPGTLVTFRLGETAE